MPPRAVLFDFDGVIADTDNIHIVAWERTFGEMGWNVPPEQCERAAELDDREFLAELFQARGIEGGDVEGWVGRKQTLTVMMLRHTPRVFPGIVELVGRLRGRVRLAVVSTTWRENIATVLEAAGLAEAFRVVVGKQDVKVVKPDAECYRKALRRLRLRPEEAVALEDSSTGLAAAQGAGIPAIAVGHRQPPGDWAGDAPYVAALVDVEAVLRLLGLSGPEEAPD